MPLQSIIDAHREQRSLSVLILEQILLEEEVECSGLSTLIETCVGDFQLAVRPGIVLAADGPEKVRARVLLDVVAVVQHVGQPVSDRVLNRLRDIRDRIDVRKLDKGLLRIETLVYELDNRVWLRN